MGKLKDLTGQRFGRLTVINFAGKKKNQYYWNCLCDCGKICTVCSGHLHNGHTQSCGCIQKERTSQARAVHKMAGTRIYRIWYEIKRRCTNTDRTNYERYGGRGITVCDEWGNDFLAFYDYVSKLEHFGEEGYSLDRIDNDGNYEPGNVRWATPTEQALNRRATIIVEYDGKKFYLQELAEQLGIKYATLRARYHRGLCGEKLFQPVRQNS